MSEHKLRLSELPVQYRAANIEVKGYDAEKHTLTYVLSTENPVERWYGFEILEHSASAIDTERLADGMPQLFNHDTDKHIGAIESYRIVNKELEVTCRFGSNPLALEKEGDVRDRILKKASVGYIVRDAQLVGIDDAGNETWRITRWTPVEGSLCTIPADNKSGTRRDAELFAVRVLGMPPAEAPKPSKRAAGCTCPCAECEDGNCADCSCEDCDCDGCTCDESRTLNPTQPAQAETTETKRMEPTTVGTDARAVERARVNEINALARQYPKQISADQADKFVNEDSTVADVRKFVLDAQIADSRQNEVRNLNMAGLTEKDKENYSLLRAFATAASGGNCFELEVSEEIGRKLGRQSEKGFFVPMDVKMRASDHERGLRNAALYGMAQRTGLDATSGSTGSNVIFTEYVSLIELLRNKMMVRALGATVLSGLQDTIAFPKQASAGTAYWVADNPGTDVADSNLTFSQITMSPKLLQSSTSYSRKLLLQNSVDVEALVRNDLMKITALAIDLAALNGSGINNQPLGIFNQTGVGSVLTANATLTKSPFVDLETAVAEANADIGTAAYLTHPAVRGKLKKTPELNNTIALPIWYKGEVNDTRAEVTMQMPTFNITTPSTYTGYGVVYGVWDQLMVGEWGALEVIVDPYRLKKQGMIEVTTFDTCDVNVRHPQSFAVITDANPLS
jgi:HK97 family phage major capsid protein